MIKTIQEYAAILFAGDTAKLTDHLDSQTSMFSIAVVMYHVVKADGTLSKEETVSLVRFFQDEFGLEEDETFELFDAVAEIGEPLYTQLKVLKEQLPSGSMMREHTFRHLNNLIICDGCVESEYKVFEKVKAVLL